MTTIHPESVRDEVERFTTCLGKVDALKRQRERVEERVTAAKNDADAASQEWLRLNREAEQARKQALLKGEAPQDDDQAERLRELEHRKETAHRDVELLQAELKDIDAQLDVRTKEKDAAAGLMDDAVELELFRQLEAALSKLRDDYVLPLVKFRAATSGSLWGRDNGQAKARSKQTGVAVAPGGTGGWRLWVPHSSDQREIEITSEEIAETYEQVLRAAKPRKEDQIMANRTELTTEERELCQQLHVSESDLLVDLNAEAAREPQQPRFEYCDGQRFAGLLNAEERKLCWSMGVSPHDYLKEMAKGE